MTTRTKRQILDEIVDMRGRQGRLGQKLRVNRDRNWLLALVLASYAREVEGREPTKLDRIIVDAFDEAGLGDRLREHGALFSGLPVHVRRELFPDRFAHADEAAYTLEDLVRDLPDLDRAVRSMPNAADVDVAAVHRGEVHLRDVPRPRREVTREHGGELVRAVAADDPRTPAAALTDPYLIKATTFRCLDETGADFLGSDEVYWIFGSVGSGAAVTSRSHIFSDIDSGDSATFRLDEGVIWGHEGKAGPLPEGEVGALVQLWEHDSGDPDEVKAAVAAAFAAAAGVLAATGVAAWVAAVVAGVGAVVSWLVGFMDDDHIGDQTFVFTRQTIVDQLGKAGRFFELTRPFTDGGGDYTMTLRVSHAVAGAPEVLDRSGALGAPAAAGSPTACHLAGPGVENIAYRDTSGRLHELWRDANGGTGTTDLTSNAGAPRATGNPFAYVDTARDTEILLFRGTDGNVRSLYWSTGAVGHDDLSGSAGAPRAAGDPVGYYDRAGDAHHVVYRGGNGHLHELFWFGLAPVGYGGNLTQGVSAPPSAGDPSAYVGGGFNIVVYRAVDGRILSVYWADGPSGLDDLSGTAGTPHAQGDPVAYYTPHSDTHQVVYRAGDGHLYELFWVGTAPVVGWDLTAASGAPSAVGDPAAFYDPVSNTKHVAFRSANGRLHELTWVPGSGSPLHEDLTSLAAAPPAADGPVGLATPGAFTRHVVYRGSDGHVYEVRRA